MITVTKPIYVYADTNNESYCVQRILFSNHNILLVSMSNHYEKDVIAYINADTGKVFFDKPFYYAENINFDIAIIVAVSKNNVIGKNNKLVWHIPEDLKHFKSITTGFPIIMGRKTYESIGKPLPNRENVVLTTQQDSYKHNHQILSFSNIDDTILHYQKRKIDKIFIIGGSSIYEQFIPFASELYITQLKNNYEGDSYLQPFDLVNFKLKSDIAFEHGIFLHYKKKF